MANFSNPTKQNEHWFRPGDHRGDPNLKDAFYQMNIVLIRNITFKEVKFQRVLSRKIKLKRNSRTH